MDTPVEPTRADHQWISTAVMLRTMLELSVTFQRLMRKALDGGDPNSLAPFVPSPPPVVTAMLDLAQVTAADHVLDLGCGDGRIVFAAAQRGASAVGVDSSPDRIAECTAQMNGQSDRVRFLQSDLRDPVVWQEPATVVTVYLLSASMTLLKAQFQSLAPGTRIVSHDFTIDGWTPTTTTRVDVPDKWSGVSHLYLWIVPPQPSS